MKNEYININELDNVIQQLNEMGWGITRIEYKRMSNILYAFPVIKITERNHGEWTKEGYCPFCKCDMPAFIEDWEWKRCQMPYCPNCGAEMQERREE